jgi:hypothetical protein
LGKVHNEREKVVLFLCLDLISISIRLLNSKPVGQIRITLARNPNPVPVHVDRSAIRNDSAISDRDILVSWLDIVSDDPHVRTIDGLSLFILKQSLHRCPSVRVFDNEQEFEGLLPRPTSVLVRDISLGVLTSGPSCSHSTV